MTSFPSVPRRHLRPLARCLARQHQRLRTGLPCADHLAEIGDALGISQNQLTREDVTGDGPKWRAALVTRQHRLADALAAIGFDAEFDTYAINPINPLETERTLQ